MRSTDEFIRYVKKRPVEQFSDIKVPEVLRPYVYSLYINMFHVNLSEALNEDLKSYPSLADFFSRQIKDDVRTIERDSCLVSPCDGTVLNLGPVQNEDIEQVSRKLILNRLTSKIMWLRNRKFRFSD